MQKISGMYWPEENKAYDPQEDTALCSWVESLQREIAEDEMRIFEIKFHMLIRQTLVAILQRMQATGASFEEELGQLGYEASAKQALRAAYAALQTETYGRAHISQPTLVRFG